MSGWPKRYVVFGFPVEQFAYNGGRQAISSSNDLAAAERDAQYVRSLDYWPNVVVWDRETDADLPNPN